MTECETERGNVIDEIPMFTTRYRAVYDFSKQTYMPAGFVPVRTSVGAPRFIPAARQWPFASEIAPYGLTKISDRGEFVQKYRARLEKHGVDAIRLKLAGIAADYEGKELALCCFEDLATESWCHRTLFAEWWAEQTGQVLREINEAVDLPVSR
jgi:hypothetical protein